MRELSARRYGQGLAMLMAMRVLAVVALWLWLPAEYRFWHAYDHYAEWEYFRIAQAIAQGAPVSSFRTIGYSLLLAPFVRVANAAAPGAIIAPVVLLQGCVLGGAGIWLVARVAWLWTGRRGTALLAAALWTALPLAIFVGVRFVPAAAYLSPYPELELRIRRLGYLLYMEMAPDGMNLCLTLLGWWACLEARRHAARLWPMVAGGAFGLAALTMPASLVFGIAGLAVLWPRRGKAWPWYLAAFGCVLLLQAAYWWRTEGVPWPQTLIAEERQEMGYGESLTHRTSLWSAVNILPNLSRVLGKFSWGTSLLGVAASLLVLAGVRRMARRESFAGWLWCGWVAPLTLVMSAYWGFMFNGLRYLLPILPAWCVACAAACVWGRHDDLPVTTR